MKIKNQNHNKLVAIWIIIALLVIGAGFAVYRLTSHKTPVTQSMYTKGETGGSTTIPKGQTPTTTGQNQTPNNSSQPGDTKSDSGGSATTELVTPTGDFVSAHHVTLSSSLVSVCNTTPGARCQITFTNGGTTKSLASEETDRGGSTYWNNWTPQSVGLTPGTWTIHAVATLNGQTKSASDAMDLVVTQ